MGSSKQNKSTSTLINVGERRANRNKSKFEIILPSNYEKHDVKKKCNYEEQTIKNIGENIKLSTKAFYYTSFFYLAAKIPNRMSVSLN